MKVELEGKIAIVTGAGGCIGRAISRTLTDNGATVILADLTAASCQGMEEELPRSRVIPCDVTDEESVKTLVATIMADYGHIDILVNNAGINTPVEARRNIDEYQTEIWDKIMSVDLKGVYNMSKHVSAEMVRQKSGRIIHISSVAGVVALRLQSAFVAAKGGVIAFSRAMALELAPHNVQVNVVAPGSISNADFKDASKNIDLLSHIPAGRQGRPEEIASLVAFLSAPEAGYITGSMITADGGWTCGFMRNW